MTSNDRIDRTMSIWLREDAAFRVPDHLSEVLQVTRETRQRPAWSSLERWLPVDTTFRPRLFTLPPAGRLVMVAALILLVLAIAILAVGSYQQRLPEPFGLARNGLFVTSRDGELYLLDPVTTEPRQLSVGDGFDFSPIFSRDGTRMVFLRSDGPIKGPAILTMMVADADGSNLRAVTPPTESLDWFDWSPDGTRVAYMAKGRLYVVDVEVAGGEPVRLVDAGPVHFPTWLPPDGKDIVFRQETENPGIYAIPADGSGTRRLLSRTPANNEFDYQGIAVSPDGSKISFTRWSGAGIPRVYALDVASGTERRFPTTGRGQVGSAFYSPDGGLVAYARLHAGRVPDRGSERGRIGERAPHRSEEAGRVRRDRHPGCVGLYARRDSPSGPLRDGRRRRDAAPAARWVSGHKPRLRQLRVRRRAAARALTVASRHRQ